MYIISAELRNETEGRPDQTWLTNGKAKKSVKIFDDLVLKWIGRNFNYSHKCEINRNLGEELVRPANFGSNRKTDKTCRLPIHNMRPDLYLAALANAIISLSWFVLWRRPTMKFMWVLSAFGFRWIACIVIDKVLSLKIVCILKKVNFSSDKKPLKTVLKNRLKTKLNFFLRLRSIKGLWISFKWIVNFGNQKYIYKLRNLKTVLFLSV